MKIYRIHKFAERITGWTSAWTEKYVEVIKNPNPSEIKSLIKKSSFSKFADNHVGIIISGGDVYAFNRNAEYHNNVVQRLNIPSPSVSGLYYPLENFFFITDATSKEMQDTPLAYDMVRKKFGSAIEIKAFNEDVVGSWDKLDKIENSWDKLDKIEKDKNLVNLVVAQSNNISISLDKYSESLKNRIDDIAAFNVEEFHRLSEFSFNPDFVINSLNEVKYPSVENVRQLLESKNMDMDRIHEIIMGIFEWYKQRKDYRLWEKISPVVKALNDYYDILNGNKITWTDEFCEKFFKENVEKTTSNMKNVEINIREAIARIKNWNGSRILIEAAPVHKDKEGFDQDSAHITVIGGQGDAGEAGFSYFQMDDKYEIDDVLDAGDTDFFQDDGVQSDYFGLVNSLRNPRMNEEKPKVLTLYTARPVADRNIYLDAKEIPSNIFLTDKYDFAEGFAREYGGKRDIWKVRILNKYLIKSMDSVEQKQYQTFGDKFVPVVSIEMIAPWTES